jgi:hypothetical protein
MTYRYEQIACLTARITQIAADFAWLTAMEAALAGSCICAGSGRAGLPSAAAGGSGRGVQVARAGAEWSFPRGGWRGRKGQGLGCQGGLVKAAAEYLRRGDGLLGQAGDLCERVLARRRPGNEIEVLAVESG